MIDNLEITFDEGYNIYTNVPNVMKTEDYNNYDDIYDNSIITIMVMNMIITIIIVMIKV